MWEEKKDAFREAVHQAVDVDVSRVNVTSIDGGGPVTIAFSVFQGGEYSDAKSIRDKINDPATAAVMTELIEQKTGMEVVVGPQVLAERQVVVDSAGNVSEAVTWRSPTSADIVAGAVGGAVGLAFLGICIRYFASFLVRRRKRMSKDLPVCDDSGGIALSY